MVFGNAGFRCTIGFNARQALNVYFLTAAHCVGDIGTPVFADPNGLVPIGLVAAKDETHDYALVRYTDASIPKPSAVNLYNDALQPITAVTVGGSGNCTAGGVTYSSQDTRAMSQYGVTVY